jgi:uncharacterized protein
VIRATLDTNVLASGFTYETSIPGRILEHWRLGQFDLVFSDTIIQELRRTLHRPYFAARITASEREDALAKLEADSSKITLQPFPSGVATHPEDDLILATAVQGHAHYLVTGDRQLQLLASHAGVAIVSPRAFLAALDGD